jgi:mRNA interferase MazF
VNRGEVWWVEDPEVGARPHVVLTRDTAIPVLHAILVAPATRTMRGIPTEVRVGVEDGMPDECVLSLDNATLMPKAYLRERICELPSERMQHVCKALAIATGCA